MIFEGSFEFDSDIVREAIAPNSEWCVAVIVNFEIIAHTYPDSYELAGHKLVGVRTADGIDLVGVLNTNQDFKREVNRQLEEKAWDLFCNLTTRDFLERD